MASLNHRYLCIPHHSTLLPHKHALNLSIIYPPLDYSHIMVTLWSAATLNYSKINIPTVIATIWLLAFIDYIKVHPDN